MFSTFLNRFTIYSVLFPYQHFINIEVFIFTIVFVFFLFKKVYVAVALYNFLREPPSPPPQTYGTKEEDHITEI